MNRVRLSASTNIKETGRFLMAILISLGLIYIGIVTSEKVVDFRPSSIQSISCEDLKNHLTNIQEIRQLKRYRYESLEAYYRMNCMGIDNQHYIIGQCNSTISAVLFKEKIYSPFYNYTVINYTNLYIAQ